MNMDRTNRDNRTQSAQEATEAWHALNNARVKLKNGLDEFMSSWEPKVLFVLYDQASLRFNTRWLVPKAVAESKFGVGGKQADAMTLLFLRDDWKQYEVKDPHPLLPPVSVVTSVMVVFASQSTWRTTAGALVASAPPPR